MLRQRPRGRERLRVRAPRRRDPYNEICLEHSSFACGGTDCSPFCEPFSHAPKERYRFVGRVEYDELSLGKRPFLHVEKFCVATQ